MLRIFRHYFPIPTLVLAVVEFAAFAAAIFLITQAGGAMAADSVALLVRFSLASALVILLVMMAVGLFNSDTFLDYRLGLVRTLMALAFIVPLTAVGILSLRALSDLPRQASWSWNFELVIAWLICLGITRAAFLHVSSLEFLKRRVLVLGTGKRALRVKSLAEEGRGPHRFVPVAFVNACGDPALVKSLSLSLDKDADRTLLARRTRELAATEIVLATDDRRGMPVHQLLECKLAGIRITDYVSFCERETGAVDLSALQPSWFIFGDGFHSGIASELVKRSFDVIVSVVFLTVVLPVILLTMIAIKLESRGPVLYRQPRVGLLGREFVLLKFRSMQVDAEQNGAPQWAQRNDARVTRVGALIRKVRIDELPQLVNVIRGEMSFVGPRPERPFFVNQLAQQLQFYCARHSVRPGITGWAQVNYPYGASVEDARQKLSYDLYYLKNRGVFLDLVILIQTVRVILWPAGAR